MTAAAVAGRGISGYGGAAFVALGANLGDRMTYLREAVEQLAAHPCIRVVCCSQVIETPPMGPQDQGPYLNAVVVLESTLPPDGLLVLCQQIEKAGKRQRTVRWGPRTIDLDLIDVGGVVMNTPTLRLPHPELRARAFVLIPLGDVAPDWKHPETGESIESLVRAINRRETVRVVAEAGSWCPRVGRSGGIS